MSFDPFYNCCLSRRCGHTCCLSIQQCIAFHDNDDVEFEIQNQLNMQLKSCNIKLRALRLASQFAGVMEQNKHLGYFWEETVSENRPLTCIKFKCSFANTLELIYKRSEFHRKTVVTSVLS